jgi:hypothetical protein
MMYRALGKVGTQRPRVPADMVGVQMRAHHIVDVVDRQPDGRQFLLEAVAIEHVPKRPGRARLVVADAGIDQNVVVRRLDHKTLDAEQQSVRGIDKFRLQPGTVLIQDLFRQIREKSHRIEESTLLLDDWMYRDVVERNRHGHCGASPRLDCFEQMLAARRRRASMRRKIIAALRRCAFRSTARGSPQFRAL